MPPVSNMRKSSATTMAMGDPHSSTMQNSGANPRRTTASGRAIRANTTRPTNYYARPFGSIGTAADHDVDMQDAGPPGFFPALQYFTDAITALPKEVMKQFTLMKEVEAKVYGPNEKLGEMIDNLMEQPVPVRRQLASIGAGVAGAQGLLSLTANNSTNGSANASLVNGVAGRYSAQPSLLGSATGEELMDTEEERIRRQQYHELRMFTHSLLANLDEKNVVLAEANRVLAQQSMRLDSVMPHVDNEISEEARWGSLTHWAYSDNKKNNKVTAPTGRGNVDKLADAANLLHEREILQARKDARTEANRDKPKGKRTELADSDYDNDKPRKGAKGPKGKAVVNASAATGLGISTHGEPATKRKKVAEKGVGAPPMERTISGTGKGNKGRDTPRSTPAVEPPAKKAPKPKPVPMQARKKLPASAHNSPMLASSPLAASFNPATMEVPPGARPQSARLRQNSSATNLRHERVQEEDSSSRPISAAGRTNGNSEKTNGRRKVQETTEQHEEPREEQTARQLKEASEKLKHEDTDMADARAEERQPASRSGSNSRKNSGRQSKVGTPRTESFPLDATMQRARSTRSKPNARGESSSAEPPIQGPAFNKHRRNMSNSHLVKQLAPFNKSPDLDRHRNKDDMDEDLDSLEDRGLEEDQEQDNDTDKAPPLERETRRSSTRRPVSRRNTANSTSHLRSSPAPISRESSAPASPPPTNTRSTGRIAAASAHEEEATVDDETRVGEEEDEDSEHDPDDPNEPKYCYCNRESYGEMVACDNDDCPKEWFHLGCTELRETPSEEEKWYCRQCRPLFGAVKVGRKGKAGRGRGG